MEAHAAAQILPAALPTDRIAALLQAPGPALAAQVLAHELRER